jgi:hypothetical protein
VSVCALTEAVAINAASKKWDLLNIKKQSNMVKQKQQPGRVVAEICLPTWKQVWLCNLHKHLTTKSQSSSSYPFAGIIPIRFQGYNLRFQNSE